jgi:predicted nucleic acid-binding protein
MFRAAASRRSRLLTTDLVLAEVHRFFLFRAGIRPALHALRRIDASALVGVIFTVESHHRTALGWIEKLGDQQISYTDAVSFAVMDEAGCRAVLSFDHDFVLAGFVPWRLPAPHRR